MRWWRACGSTPPKRRSARDPDDARRVHSPHGRWAWGPLAHMADGTRLSVPRYRVEERTPDLAAFIVGFADTPAQYRTLLARRAAQLIRARVRAELVVIDQESEAIVVRRDVWVPPESRPQLP